MLKLVPIFLLAILAGLLGSVLSKQVKDGASIWVYLLGTAWMGPLSWVFMSKHTPWNMLVTSAVWTAIFETAWFLGTIFLIGEQQTISQIVGAFIVLCGIIIMSL